MAVPRPPRRRAQQFRPMSPLADARSALVPFANSPFPYHGAVPSDGAPFLNVSADGRLGRRSPRGGVHWEDETYSDRRVLLHLPRGFDPARPALLVVFLHGNNATLERDVIARQRVPAQLDEAGVNAALAAPQFAVDAADSSAGRFWEAGAFARFLDEAAAQLAGLYGNSRARRLFAAMPVVIVAYSGGYQAAAYALERGGADPRIRGVVLLDALYGETGKFADWLRRRRPSAFFVSAYSGSSREQNLALQALLRQRHESFATELPAQLDRGGILFVSAPDAAHNDFVTRAWTADPIADLLRRLPPFRLQPLPEARAAPPPGLS